MPASELSHADPGHAAAAALPAFDGVIVALGASAGGLDALDRFFTALPPCDDAAFIVIQHLSPDHKTMMDNLLARHTAMSVAVAEHDVPLQGGHVYVIPPGKTMTLEQGRLQLAPKPLVGLSLPIDAFFESLAAQPGSRAIGVVLSGTGSDGSKGLQALDASGAWIFAQDPATARFDGMPLAAIGTGMVDKVLAPEDLALEVASCVLSGEGTANNGAVPQRLAAPTSVDPVLRQLVAQARIDFADYKPNMVLRRIERRMLTTRAASVEDYVARLQGDADELEALRRELLIPVTRFFRDGEVFAALAEQVIGPLVDARRTTPSDPIRVWVACCATGEEAYTVAMLLAERIERSGVDIAFKIFATDVEPRYLEVAGAGRYPGDAVQQMPPEMAARFVTLSAGHCQMRADLRQRIVFARHNLLGDAPFTQMDLVVCRNMMIYLRPHAQVRAIGRLGYAVKPGGTLMLGLSESLAGQELDYAAIDARNKIYRLLRRTAAPPDGYAFAAPPAARAVASRAPVVSTEQRAVDQAVEMLLGRFAPPSLLVTPRRELVHVFGEGRRYLRFAPGVVSLDVLQLLPEPLAPLVATLLHSAMRDREPQQSRPVRLESSPEPGGAGEQGGHEAVRLRVAPLEVEGVVTHLVVSIEALQVPSAQSVAGPGGGEAYSDLAAQSHRHVAELERELAATRVNLQDTIQDLGTANEELQATNEELMAANEELQSTNEELQSVNEELHTVNAEYQSKIVSLNALNADLEGLTRATRIPILFVDAELRVQRFTPEATRLFKLRETDMGRPLDDFAHQLDYPELFTDVRRALEGGASTLRETRSEDGRLYLATVLPYRDLTQTRPRAVLCFTDVTVLKDAQRLQIVLDALPEHVAVLDSQGVIQIVNHAWREFAERNGDRGLRYTGPGADYLRVCQAAAASDDDARRAAEGIADVIAGRRPAFTLRYPCHSADEQRWFLMQSTPLAAPLSGCVVTHLNITGWLEPRVAAVSVS